MKRAFWMLVLAAACAGCGESHSHHGRHHHEYAPGDGGLSLHGDEIVIRAGGEAEAARVGPDGGLRIGERVIDTGDDGRHALQAYDREALAIVDHGVAIGMAGARFGLETLKNVLHGLFHGGAERAGARAEQGAKELKASALKLCDRFASLYEAQQAAAVAIPEFRPYAVISEKQVHECREADDDKDDEAGPESEKPST